VTVEKSDHLAEQLKAAFVQSPVYEAICSIFDKATSNQIKDNFTLFYLNDLLIISSHDSFINETHLRLVKNRLLNYCREKYSLCTRDLESLVIYHLALDDLKQEFSLFAKFAQLNPNILEQILEERTVSLNLCFQASSIITGKLASPKFVFILVISSLFEFENLIDFYLYQVIK